MLLLIVLFIYGLTAEGINEQSGWWNDAANASDLTIRTLKQSVAEVKSHSAVDYFGISGNHYL